MWGHTSSNSIALSKNSIVLISSSDTYKLTIQILKTLKFTEKLSYV